MLPFHHYFYREIHTENNNDTDPFKIVGKIFTFRERLCLKTLQLVSYSIRNEPFIHAEKSQLYSKQCALVQLN